MEGRLFGVTMLLLAAQGAQAEWSATLAGTTDYDFRGISQTEGDPALLGSVDWSSGLFYASLWGSNVDFGTDVDGDIEIDVVLGLAGEFSDNLGWDVGATYYYYPSSSDGSSKVGISNYYEVYAGGNWGPVDARLWYSDNYYDRGDDGWYLEGNFTWPLPWWELELTAHAGYSFGDYYDEVEKSLSDPSGSDYDPDYAGDDYEYADYSVALGRSFGQFDTELKFVTTNTDHYFDIDSGAAQNDSRVLLTVSTTFPWGRE